MYKFITTEPLIQGGAANQFTKALPAGRFLFLQVAVTGTTDAGQTLTLADMPRITVEVNGDQKILSDGDFLNSYTDLKGGYPSKPTGSAATAERVVFEIPFFIPGFPNVMQLRDNNEAKIIVEAKSSMVTKFGTNPVNIRIDAYEVRDVYQSYFLKISPQNIQASAASTLPENLAGRNLVALYLRSNDVGKVQLQVDGKTIVDNTPLAVLRDGTNIINKIESAGQPWVEIQVAGASTATTRNNTAEVQADFTGSGTLELYRFNFEWLNQADIDANQAAVEQSLRG